MQKFETYELGIGRCASRNISGKWWKKTLMLKPAKDISRSEYNKAKY